MVCRDSPLSTNLTSQPSEMLVFRAWGIGAVPFRAQGRIILVYVV